MGGLAGVAFCGPDVSESARTMASMMRYRAPDGTSEARGSDFHFVNLYRRPHLEYNQNAPNLSVGDKVFVTSDSRIDNRNDLLAQLGMHSASDNELIYAAWTKWGDAFPEKLLGDFAFAIYQEKAQRLLLGRDVVGVKPLFYAWTSEGFAFASELVPIAHLLQKQSVNYSHVRAFLIGEAADTDETMIEGIFRVPPGHILKVDARRITELNRYWDPHEIPASPETSPAKLWDILCNSVRQRSKSTGKVGFACSGGLDSTSICYAAASCGIDAILPLRTFSIVFDKTPAESERSYIENALKGLPAEATFVDMSDYDPLDDLAVHLKEQGRLFHAPGLAMMGKLYQQIREADCEVFIDGHGGDEVISHGFQRLTELAVERRWLELWRCTAAAAATFGSPRSKTFLTYWLRYGMHRMPRLRRRLVKTLWPNSSDEQILGPALKGLISESGKVNGPSSPSRNAAHVASVFNRSFTDSIEILELAAARRGLEIRFPFFDRRLIEYALSLPEEAKLQGRWTRVVLREAISKIVPDTVRLRTEKFDFTSHLARGILQSKDRTLNSLTEAGQISGLLNTDFIKKALLSLNKSGPHSSNSDVILVWRSILLSKWNGDLKKGDEL